MKDKLQAAITRDDLDEVKRVIAETEDSGVTTEALSESLILACENGHLNMIAYLLAVNGVDVNYMYREKKLACPLIAAIKKKHTKVAELLLKHHNIDVYAGL